MGVLRGPFAGPRQYILAWHGSARAFESPSEGYEAPLYGAGPRESRRSCAGPTGPLRTLKTKMSNQAQIKHKLNATVHYCSRSKPLLTASTQNTRTTFVFSQHKSLRLRCGLEPNKDKSHKSRTARTQENYLKALTKSKNMVKFGKQAKHFTAGFKRGAAGKNTLLHRKMQETLQKPN